MPHDDDDIFADVHGADEREVQRGFAAGVRDGMVNGVHEGRELGVQKGFEIGVELGFYKGCVRTWRALQQAQQLQRAAEGVAALTVVAQPAVEDQGNSRGGQVEDAQGGPAGQGEGALIIPPRAERGLAALEQLLDEFPALDPQDERLHDLLERIRGRFKAVSATLGFLHDFLAQPGGAAAAQAGSAQAATQSPARAGAVDLSF